MVAVPPGRFPLVARTYVKAMVALPELTPKKDSRFSTLLDGAIPAMCLSTSRLCLWHFGHSISIIGRTCTRWGAKAISEMTNAMEDRTVS